MSIIEELRQQRSRLGLSQTQVAATMGTTQSALSRAERGGNPTQDFLQRYSDALQALASATDGAAKNSTDTTNTDTTNAADTTNVTAATDKTDNHRTNASTVEIATMKFIIGSIAQKYGLSEVYVYGSTARGDADADSDIDLLYRAESGNHLSMMRREALQHELEGAFNRAVSLTSLDSLQRNAQRSRASRRFYLHIQPDMIRVA